MTGIFLYEQGVWLTDRMRAAGAEAELETIEAGDEKKADARMFDFFARHLALVTERELLIADHGPGKEVLAVSWPSGKALWRSPNMGGRDCRRFPVGTCFTPWTPGGGSSRSMHSEKSCGPWGSAVTGSAGSRAPGWNGNTLIGEAKTGTLLEVELSGKTGLVIPKR